MRHGYALLFLLVLPFAALAQDASSKSVYKDAEAGKGKLRYVNDVPVLLVEGTPEEIGEQFGKIGITQGKAILDQIDPFIENLGWKAFYPFMLKTSGFMVMNFPKNVQKEVDAAAKASGVDKNLVVFANCVADLMKVGGCSTIIVEPARSSTGGPLFGRLLDWPYFKGMAQNTLVTVFKPTGKHAFASVLIPPMLGAITGMNDAGLCISINEITASKDGSSKLNVSGTPMMLLFRRVLEECTTVDEAEKLLNAASRTSWYCVTVCDAKTGSVFEVTPKTVNRRNPENCVCLCTNHFRTDGLKVNDKCDRYAKLEPAQKGDVKMGVKEVQEQMHQVNQGKYTLHAFVFEPARKVMHVSIRDGDTATGQPYKEVDLGAIFEKGLK